VSSAARARVSGPIRTGEPDAATMSACSTGTLASSQPGVVTAPQHGQSFEIRAYSVTLGGGAGWMSTI
jgi:hypothetical protein